MKPKKGEGTYNAVIIGAGTAGLVTAAGTAGLGGRVALIERNLMGGDCLNFGCVPSKALISSARLIQQMREAEMWGLKAVEPKFELGEILTRMQERRATIAPNDSQERFESLGVDIFRGEAKFLSPNEVEVDGQKLRAKNFVIATGSRAAVPEIDGLDSVPYFTNETIFDHFDPQTKSLIVLGGGPIGCELGQAFRRFGLAVTLLQDDAQLLPPEDRDVAEFIEKRFAAEGVDVRLKAKAKSFAQRGQKIVAAFEKGDPVTADALLVSAGRTPNIETLDLKAAGVKFSKHGVDVNDYLQTSQRHIYAVGDVANRLKFTHTADATARVAVRNILMPLQLLRQKVDLSIVPWCTYTDPEVAHVGLGEKEAKKQKIAYDLFQIPLSEVDRAIVESEEAGFLKVLTEKGSDKILGAVIVGPHAGDLIHEFVVAMHAKVGLGQLASMIHAYPTLAEMAHKAGDKFNKTRLTPRAKKIFGWLYARAR